MIASGPRTVPDGIQPKLSTCSARAPARAFAVPRCQPCASVSFSKWTLPIPASRSHFATSSALFW